jgi:hypothetical protein
MTITNTKSLLLNSTLYKLVLSFFLKKNGVAYNTWDNFIQKSSFITVYYSRNENMWGDGFLFDFLQKKTADAWVRRFVIYTGFLFSERLVFDSVVRVYLDNLIWPGHSNSIFEVSNVSEMLSHTIFVLISLFFIVVLVWPFVLL